ncbi:unnamed protein product, partial [Ectocarpus sp. 12 AP-2014]
CSCLTSPAPSSVPLPSVYDLCSLCQVVPKKFSLFHLGLSVYRLFGPCSVNGLWHLHFFISPIIYQILGNKNQYDATKAARRASSTTTKRTKVSSQSNTSLRLRLHNIYAKLSSDRR